MKKVQAFELADLSDNLNVQIQNKTEVLKMIVLMRETKERSEKVLLTSSKKRWRLT